MAEDTFEIIDDVRRAKSHELLGKETIPAEIIDDEGSTIAKREVSIDSLQVTTKRSIDVSTQKDWERFMKTFHQVKAGSPTPPILITPGDEGRKLQDIQLDPTGESD
jgi:hypothetical protein